MTDETYRIAVLIVGLLSLVLLLVLLPLVGNLLKAVRALRGDFDTHREEVRRKLWPERYEEPTAALTKALADTAPVAAVATPRPSSLSLQPVFTERASSPTPPPAPSSRSTMLPGKRR